MPIEPVSIAAASDRMSPNTLPVTITSNCLGARISMHRRRVDEEMRELDIGILGADARHTSRQSCIVSSTLALSTEHTFRRRSRAVLNATCAMRSISDSE